MRDRLGDVDRDDFVEKSKETVTDFLWRWMDTYAATNTTPRTQQGYRVNIRRMLPYIGSIPLQKLRPQHIQKMYASLTERGLSAQTVRLTHRTLSEALSHAVGWDVLKRNVASAATAPKPKRQQQQMWDAPTVHRFLSIAENSPFADFYHLAVRTGMRRSELAGLRWEYVDLERLQLSVVSTLQRITGRGLLEGQPKTLLLRRMIALSLKAVSLLKSIQKKQIEQRLAAGPVWENTGYVFTQRNGRKVDSDKITRDFTSIVRDNDLPYITLKACCPQRL